jgi:hypothetical protein
MTFNLTPKRLEVLEFIASHPGCMVGAIAQRFLAGHRTGTRGLWSQQATRSGAGYCQKLAAENYVKIRYTDVGYGEVYITSKGQSVVRSAKAQKESL